MCTCLRQGVMRYVWCLVEWAGPEQGARREETSNSQEHIPIGGTIERPTRKIKTTNDDRRRRSRVKR